MVNCGPFQSIAALTTVVATYPLPSAMCQASCTCIPRAACTQLAGVRVSKKDLVLQIWVICVLAVCWLCKEVSSYYCCMTLHCCNPLFLWPTWFPADLRLVPILLCLSFSFLILLGTRYYQTRTFRNNCMYGGNEKVITNIWGEKSGWKHTKFDEGCEYKHPSISMTSSKMNLKRPRPRHIIIKLLKDRDIIIKLTFTFICSPCEIHLHCNPWGFI